MVAMTLSLFAVAIETFCLGLLIIVAQAVKQSVVNISTNSSLVNGAYNLKDKKLIIPVYPIYFGLSAL